MNKKYLIITVIIAILGCLAVFIYKKSHSTMPIDTKGGKKFKSRLLLEVPLYQQNDPRWNDQTINTGETIANVGCTLCCVAMTFDYYGLEIKPNVLNDYLKKNEGYTYKGWLKWQKCANYNKQLAVFYVGNPSHEIIESSLQKGFPVIVQVYVPNGIAHWVLIVGKDGYEYLINDPLSKETPIPLSTYGEKMYAARIFGKVSSSSMPETNK